MLRPKSGGAAGLELDEQPRPPSSRQERGTEKANVIRLNHKDQTGQKNLLFYRSEHDRGLTIRMTSVTMKMSPERIPAPSNSP